ncbi:MAG TPA: IPT/TIG domain-containing protein [Candidatus Binatia bacterium]|nr:IPT/TIG domain-containing protein [Candidatus Binatia bacterium]
MKPIKAAVLCAFIAFSLACGYSSHSSTPAVAGTTPNISALEPNNVSAGTTGNVLTVNGANFNSNAAINWNGSALTTTYVSAAQLTTKIPDADVAASGTAAVTVTNPGTPGGQYGGGTMAETSNSMTFTIN